MVSGGVEVSGDIAWGFNGADGAELDSKSDAGEFHGAVESGVLIGGATDLSRDGKSHHACHAATLFGDEVVVKLDSPSAGTGIEAALDEDVVDLVEKRKEHDVISGTLNCV